MLKLPLLVSTLLAASIAHAADVPALPAAVSAPASDVGGEQSAWRAVFAAIRSRDFAGAQALIDARAPNPLAAVAKAELLLAPGAPAPDPQAVAAVAASAPGLPEAPALVRLARSYGAAEVPALPVQRPMVRLQGPSKRIPARPGRDAAAATLASRAAPLVKANDGAAAEEMVEGSAAALSPEVLTEWRQRVAWAYYLGGDDANARRMATLARSGPGDWAVTAAWTYGLSSWRAGEMDAAAEAFATVAARAADPEMEAAGHFWAARAAMAGGHPDQVAARLRSASLAGETFYGMLAAASLGLRAAPPTEPTMLTAAVLARPNAAAAAALVAIGEVDLADQLLRQQARIGAPAEHGALVALARQLGLPATQVWLAKNGPVGASLSTSARFPLVAWAPSGGWRVDPALCLAHALQESEMRVDATSRAGARGLMQLMPATARLVARHRGEVDDPAGRLGDPAVSLDYGQAYLQELAENNGTGGLLPKVIAAYNAGPNNVAAWNGRLGVGNDPLLFIESIPFAETRGYVTVVLRNYWMYQRERGTASESLAAMAQGRWPRFPVVTTPRTAAAPVRGASPIATVN